LRALLDTCALLWWVGEPDRVSASARALFEDPGTVLYWSAASSWEVALKSSRKGFHLPLPPREFVRRVLDEEGIVPLPIEDRHALHVAELPPHHRDPFDRLLVAQAQLEQMPLITGDARVGIYDVEVIW